MAAARGSVRCGAPHSSSNSRVSLRRRAAPSRNFAALHAAWAPPLLPLLPASQRAAPLSAVRRRLAARCQRHCGSSTACCSSARHGGRSGGSGAAQRSGGAVASPRLHVLRWARRCQRGVRPPQRCRRRRQRHGVRRVAEHAPQREEARGEREAARWWQRAAASGAARRTLAAALVSRRAAAPRDVACSLGTAHLCSAARLTARRAARICAPQAAGCRRHSAVRRAAPAPAAACGGGSGAGAVLRRARAAAGVAVLARGAPPQAEARRAA